MKNTPFALLILVLWLYPCGCFSIGTRMDEGVKRVYPGIREEVFYFVHPGEADIPYIQWMSIFDMPFSFIVDTVCLPHDIATIQKMKQDGEVKAKNETE